MGREHQQATKVSVESLTDEEAIFRAVRNQCFQSPLTTLPLALAGGVLLLGAAFGWGFFGVFAAVVLGLIGAASFVYNLWIRGEELTKKHVQGLMEKLKEERRTSLEEVETMCREMGFDEGAKEARELSEAYVLYAEFLESKAEAKLGPAVGQRLDVAESARKTGLEHLRQASEIHVALSGVNADALRQELTEWTQELETRKDSSPILTTKITAHKQQLERYEEMVAKRDELVANSNALEAALKNAYLSDAGRSVLSADLDAEGPAARLSRLITATEEAEKEMGEFLRSIHQETTSI